MKLILLRTFVFLAALSARAQGTFIYDQQSSTDETPPPFGSGGAIQQIATPWGQSFTPSLPAVSFIRLIFDDGNISDGRGATLYVDLRANSITGSLLGTTASVALPNNFAGVANFYFASDIPLTPGTTYYFTPVVQSGGPWNTIAAPFNYPGGSIFANGLPVTASDLWFREGLVPEPSAAALIIVGGVTFVCVRRRVGKVWDSCAR